ncbi:hypothetical protein NC651_018486 [Populus alba x Populus x berolinensis]|nr:hypothetical protein NC651_018486 [Populus alba x Populus x berolinensis]
MCSYQLSRKLIRQQEVIALLMYILQLIKLLSVISGMRLTLEKNHARLDKILQGIINEHRSKKEMAAKTGADEEEHDLVDVLFGIQDKGDTEFSLTDTNIKAIILVSMSYHFRHCQYYHSRRCVSTPATKLMIRVIKLR